MQSVKMEQVSRQSDTTKNRQLMLSITIWAAEADPGLKQGERYTKIGLILTTSGYRI